MIRPGHLSYEAFTQVATHQRSLRQLSIGEYKGHRYLINILPRVESAGMYQSPSTAYMEVAAEDIELVKRLDWEGMGYVTWTWYPGHIDICDSERHSATEGLIKGLQYTAELGIDATTDSEAEMLEFIKERIDEFEKEKAKPAAPEKEEEEEEQKQD